MTCWNSCSLHAGPSSCLECSILIYRRALRTLEFLFSSIPCIPIGKTPNADWQWTEKVKMVLHEVRFTSTCLNILRVHSSGLSAVHLSICLVDFYRLIDGHKMAATLLKIYKSINSISSHNEVIWLDPGKVRRFTSCQPCHWARGSRP